LRSQQSGFEGPSEVLSFAKQKRSLLGVAVCSRRRAGGRGARGQGGARKGRSLQASDRHSDRFGAGLLARRGIPPALFREEWHPRVPHPVGALIADARSGPLGQLTRAVSLNDNLLTLLSALLYHWRVSEETDDAPGASYLVWIVRCGAIWARAGKIGIGFKGSSHLTVHT